MPGEQIVYRARLHWIVYRWAIAWAFVALLSIPAGKDSPGVVAFFFLVAAVLAFAAFLGRRSSEFGVTNKRVIIKVGVLQTKSLETLLAKVEGIGVEQPIFGRLLGYGSIVVNGTGGTKEPFKRIEAPFEFRRHVQEQIAASALGVAAAR
jgi:uncharacterized membrane protein YdbT with pleckstrin-like domain